LRFPLFRTRPGRLFLITSFLLLAIWGAQGVVDVPVAVEFARKFVSLGWIVSVVWIGMLALRQYQFRLMWRVRRKLIVSYLFLGAVPVVLAGAFTLAVSVVLYTDIAAYIFRAGFQDITDQVQRAAEGASLEIGSALPQAQTVLDAQYARHRKQYPALSLAVVPMPAYGGPVVKSGPWGSGGPPAAMPAWVADAGEYDGLLAIRTPAAPNEDRLLIRSVVPAAGGRAMVVADLPVDQAVIDQMLQKTGMRLGAVTLEPSQDAARLDANPPSGLSTLAPSAASPGALTPFRQTKVFVDVADWTSGHKRRASIGLDAPLLKLYTQLVAAQSGQPVEGIADPTRNLFLLLFAFGTALLIVQAAFFYAGLMLARTITTAVHELLLGTERVQRGDFLHPIAITSNDQLGDLAESFNRMTTGIARLGPMERQKQRLDDELRIAREIQQSLLPVGPPVMAGLSIAAICEPAREVGGDYYDFFELAPRQLGVLIADVSGKGTSAALYMAELKGLMLALSRTERSPRQLLITVNRLLAEHLDNRSFITMTYAVIDLEAMTLTSARAGHTPLIVASGGKAELVVSEGMVLGLRFPGARARFEAMLEEDCRVISPGDVMTLYTDGITEAMDTNKELFGDAALSHILASHDDLDAPAIRERVLRDVRAFVGEAEPHDDMTMVVMKVPRAEAGR
jgi:serine phosphatase RsbU (regulator of sigma subunit)